MKERGKLDESKRGMLTLKIFTQINDEKKSGGVNTRSTFL